MMKLACEALSALLAVSLLIDAAYASAQIVTADGSSVSASEAVQKCLKGVSAQIIPSSDPVRVFLYISGAYGAQEVDLAILQPAYDCSLLTIPLADYITQLDLIGNCSAIAPDVKKRRAPAAADDQLKLLSARSIGRRLLVQKVLSQALDQTGSSKRKLADLLADAGSKQSLKEAHSMQEDMSLARMLSAKSSSALEQSPAASGEATLQSNSCSGRFNEDIAFHQQYHSLSQSTLVSNIAYYYNQDISTGNYPADLPGLCILNAATCSDECLDYASFASSTSLSFVSLCQSAGLV